MLWAITSYFNPAGYKSRLANYRTFRKHLGLPVVAVELSFTGTFELQRGDADVLVQLTGGDVLWQKERLLNVALRHLPGDCDAVAWVDCDIVFSNRDWPEQTRAALNTFPLLQVFGERCNLARSATVGPPASAAIESVAHSLGFKIATGQVQPDDLRMAGGTSAGDAAVGMAWAGRRTLLDRFGLYDARIVGGGDRALVCAMMGKFDYGVHAAQMNGRQEEHYRAWAEPFFADVRAQVGYLAGRVFHLWHGAWQDRKLALRHEGLKRFHFDPFTDIAVGANGCWRWNSDKPDLHEYVRNYFASRNEDGVAAIQAQA